MLTDQLPRIEDSAGNFAARDPDVLRRGNIGIGRWGFGENGVNLSSKAACYRLKRVVASARQPPSLPFFRGVCMNAMRWISFIVLVCWMSRTEPIFGQNHVPFYLTYQMNGIYYFYCSTDCSGAMPSMQSAARMHLLGCDPTTMGARDPIQGGVFGENGAVALVHPHGPADKLDKKVKRKKGGKPGLHLGEDDKVVAEGTVFLTDEDDEVVFDQEYKLVDTNPIAFFRVIGVKSTNVPLALKTTYFAQEVEDPSDPVRAESHTFDDSTRATITVKIPPITGLEIEVPALAANKIKLAMP